MTSDEHVSEAIEQSKAEASAEFEQWRGMLETISEVTAELRAIDDALRVTVDRFRHVRPAFEEHLQRRVAKADRASGFDPDAYFEELCRGTGLADLVEVAGAIQSRAAMVTESMALSREEQQARGQHGFEPVQDAVAG